MEFRERKHHVFAAHVDLVPNGQWTRFTFESKASLSNKKDKLFAGTRWNRHYEGWSYNDSEVET